MNLDYRKAESVVAKDGKRLLEATSERSVILTFDWDLDGMTSLSEDFSRGLPLILGLGQKTLQDQHSGGGIYVTAPAGWLVARSRNRPSASTEVNLSSTE